MKGLFVVCIAIISMFSVHFLNHYLDLIWQNIDFAKKKYALHSWIHFSFRLKRDFNWFFFTFCCCWCCLRLAWSCVSNTSAAFSTKKLKEKIVYLEKWTWLGILTKKRRKKKTDWLTHISMYLITYNIFQLTFLCEHFLF